MHINSVTRAKSDLSRIAPYGKIGAGLRLSAVIAQ